MQAQNQLVKSNTNFEYDLQKTQMRIQETDKIVEARSDDIRTKSVQLDETER